MSLQPCFAVIKEMAVGGATSGILYNLFANVMITARGLDSYTACRFHKYGCPNNTSQTSRGAMSHNTSSVKGLMLYGRQHYWLTRCCMEGDTTSSREDLVLGEATQWCMVVDVLWSVSPTTSRPLPK